MSAPALVLALAAAAAADSLVPRQLAQLQPPTNVAAAFGYSVDTHEGHVLVGDPSASTYGSSFGNAFVYEVSADGHTVNFVQQLEPADSTSDMVDFGFRVALFGDYAFVSDPFADRSATNTGLVHIFKLSGSTWSFSQEFEGELSNARIGAYGLAAANLFTAIVSDNPAEVTMLKRSGDTWSVHLHLARPAGSSGTARGIGMTGDADLMAVGYYIEDSLMANAGAVYVYHNPAGSTDDTFTLIATLYPDPASTNNYFGHSLGFDQTRLAVANYQDDLFIFAVETSGTDELPLQQHIALPITSHDPDFGELFGVSIYGNHLAVGAYDLILDGHDRGAVFMYSFDGFQWSLSSILQGTRDNSNFGFALALSEFPWMVACGTNMLVSATGHGDGACIIYSLPDRVRTTQVAHTQVEHNPSTYFGYSSDVEGNVAVVGAYLDEVASLPTNHGTARYYHFNEATRAWDLRQIITASDAAGSDYFGRAVALSSDRLLVTGYNQDYADLSNVGSVYFFELETDPVSGGAQFVEKQRIDHPVPLASQGFGSYIAIDGDNAAIGCRYCDTGATNSGHFFLLHYDGAAWQHVFDFYPEHGDGYGAVVAVSGRFALSTSPFDDDAGSNRGAVDVYERSDAGVWTPHTRLTASDGESSDFFGYGADISGDRIVVASPYTTSLDIGQLYVFGLIHTKWEELQIIPSPFTVTDSTNDDDYFGVSIALTGNRMVATSRHGGMAVYDAGTGGVGFTLTTILDGAVFPVTGSLMSDSVDFWHGLHESVAVAGDHLILASYSHGLVVFVELDVTTSSNDLVPGFNPIDELPHSTYGRAVAVHGKWLAVGDYNQENGFVYIYRYPRDSTSNPQLHTTLEAPGTIHKRFGYELDLWGGVLIVGDYYYQSDHHSPGAVYIYRYGAATDQWLQEAELIGSTPSVRFGWSVAVHDDVALIGTNTQGVVHVYVYDSGSWTQAQQLTGSGPYFGWSLAIDHAGSGSFIIGEYRMDTDTIDDLGTVFLADRTGPTTWETTEMPHVLGQQDTYFGYDVAIYGDRAVAMTRPAAYDPMAVVVVMSRSALGRWSADGTVQMQHRRPHAPWAVTITDNYLVYAMSNRIFVYGADSDEAMTQWSLVAEVATHSNGLSLSTVYNPRIYEDELFLGDIGRDVVSSYQITRTSARLPQYQPLQHVSVEAAGISIADDWAAVADDAGTVHVYARVADTVWRPAAQLTASVSGIDFGASVAIQGSVLLVGAPLHDPPAGTNAGAVFAFAHSGGDAWSEIVSSPILASDAATNAQFGSRVALALGGSRAVVLASGADAIYVFDRDPASGEWLEAAKLSCRDAFAIDADGGTLVLINPSQSSHALIFTLDPTTGSWAEADTPLTNPTGGSIEALAIFGPAAAVAYVDAPENFVNVYARSGASWDQWTLEAKLTGSFSHFDDSFGASLALGDSLLVVGAPDNNLHRGHGGAAFVFRRDPSGAWTESGYAVPSIGVDGGHFGAAVALGPSQILVSQPGYFADFFSLRDEALALPQPEWSLRTRDRGPQEQATEYGRALAASSTGFIVGAPAWNSARGRGWILQHNGDQAPSLLASSGGAGDRFGDAVALAEFVDRAFVGAPGANAVYVFDRSSSISFTQSAALTGSGQFGSALAVSPFGTTLAIGAPGDSAVHVFVMPDPTAPEVWALQAVLSDGEPAGALGSAVAMDPLGSRIFAVAPDVSPNGHVAVFDRADSWALATTVAFPLSLHPVFAIHGLTKFAIVAAETALYVFDEVNPGIWSHTDVSFGNKYSDGEGDRAVASLAFLPNGDLAAGVPGWDVRRMGARIYDSGAILIFDGTSLEFKDEIASTYPHAGGHFGLGGLAAAPNGDLAVGIPQAVDAPELGDPDAVHILTRCKSGECAFDVASFDSCAPGTSALAVAHDLAALVVGDSLVAMLRPSPTTGAWSRVSEFAADASSSLALSDDALWLATGSAEANQVSVFAGRVGDTRSWSLFQTLDGANGFGHAVALSGTGDVLVVAAVSAGTVHLYSRSVLFQLASHLVDPSLSPGIQQGSFGTAVAVHPDGAWAVVACPACGFASVFARDSAWAVFQRIPSSGTGLIALSTAHLLVGATAYHLDPVSDEWRVAQILAATEPARVALSGDRAAVLTDGTVLVYVYAQDRWDVVQDLAVAEASDNIAISGDTILVASESGAVRVLGTAPASVYSAHPAPGAAPMPDTLAEAALVSAIAAEIDCPGASSAVDSVSGRWYLACAGADQFHSGVGLGAPDTTVATEALAVAFVSADAGVVVARSDGLVRFSADLDSVLGSTAHNDTRGLDFVVRVGDDRVFAASAYRAVAVAVAVDGNFTWVQPVSLAGDGCDLLGLGLATVTAVAASPEGAVVYVAGASPDSVALLVAFDSATWAVSNVVWDGSVLADGSVLSWPAPVHALAVDPGTGSVSVAAASELRELGPDLARTARTADLDGSVTAALDVVACGVQSAVGVTGLEVFAGARHAASSVVGNTTLTEIDGVMRIPGGGLWLHSSATNTSRLVRDDSYACRSDAPQCSAACGVACPCAVRPDVADQAALWLPLDTPASPCNDRPACHAFLGQDSIIERPCPGRRAAIAFLGLHHRITVRELPLGSASVTVAAWIFPMRAVHATRFVDLDGAVVLAQTEAGAWACLAGNTTVVGGNVWPHRWAHVACVRDTPAGGVSLYVDGELAASGAAHPAAVVLDGTTVIGGGTGELIADVGVWAAALSGDAIGELGSRQAQSAQCLHTSQSPAEPIPGSTLTDTGTLDAAADDFTVSMWVRIGGNATDSTTASVARWDAQARGWALSYSAADGVGPECRLGAGPRVQYGTGFAMALRSPAVVPGAWLQVACIVSRVDQSVALHVGGQLAGVAALAGDVEPPSPGTPVVVTQTAGAEAAHAAVWPRAFAAAVSLLGNSSASPPPPLADEMIPVWAHLQLADDSATDIPVHVQLMAANGTVLQESDAVVADGSLPTLFPVGPVPATGIVAALVNATPPQPVDFLALVPSLDYDFFPGLHAAFADACGLVHIAGDLGSRMAVNGTTGATDNAVVVLAGGAFGHAYTWRAPRAGSVVVQLAWADYPDAIILVADPATCSVHGTGVLVDVDVAGGDVLLVMVGRDDTAPARHGEYRLALTLSPCIGSCGSSRRRVTASIPVGTCGGADRTDTLVLSADGGSVSGVITSGGDIPVDVCTGIGGQALVLVVPDRPGVWEMTASLAANPVLSIYDASLCTLEQCLDNNDVAAGDLDATLTVRSAVPFVAVVSLVDDLTDTFELSGVLAAEASLCSLAEDAVQQPFWLTPGTPVEMAGDEAATTSSQVMPMPCAPSSHPLRWQTVLRMTAPRAGPYEVVVDATQPLPIAIAAGCESVVPVCAINYAPVWLDDGQELLVAVAPGSAAPDFEVVVRPVPPAVCFNPALADLQLSLDVTPPSPIPVGPGTGDVYSAAPRCGLDSAPSMQRAFAFTAPFSGDFAMRISGSADFSASVFVSDDCSRMLLCRESDGMRVTVDLALAAGQTAVVLVDSDTVATVQLGPVTVAGPVTQLFQDTELDSYVAGVPRSADLVAVELGFPAVLSLWTARGAPHTVQVGRTGSTGTVAPMVPAIEDDRAVLVALPSAHPSVDEIIVGDASFEHLGPDPSGNWTLYPRATAPTPETVPWSMLVSVVNSTGPLEVSGGLFALVLSSTEVLGESSVVPLESGRTDYPVPDALWSRIGLASLHASAVGTGSLSEAVSLRVRFESPVGRLVLFDFVNGTIQVPGDAVTSAEFLVEASVPLPGGGVIVTGASARGPVSTSVWSSTQFMVPADMFPFDLVESSAGAPMADGTVFVVPAARLTVATQVSPLRADAAQVSGTVATLFVDAPVPGAGVQLVRLHPAASDGPPAGPAVLRGSTALFEQIPAGGVVAIELIREASDPWTVASVTYDGVEYGPVHPDCLEFGSDTILAQSSRFFVPLSPFPMTLSVAPDTVSIREVVVAGESYVVASRAGRDATCVSAHDFRVYVSLGRVMSQYPPSELEFVAGSGNGVVALEDPFGIEWLFDANAGPGATYSAETPSLSVGARGMVPCPVAIPETNFTVAVAGATPGADLILVLGDSLIDPYDPGCASFSQSIALGLNTACTNVAEDVDLTSYLIVVADANGAWIDSVTMLPCGSYLQVIDTSVCGVSDTASVL